MVAAPAGGCAVDASTIGADYVGYAAGTGAVTDTSTQVLTTLHHGIFTNVTIFK